MHGFAFRTGLIFEWSGIAHRLDRISTGDQIVLERLSDGQIILCTKTEFLAAYAEGAVGMNAPTADAEGSPVFGRPLEDLPDQLQTEVRRRMAYVRAIDGRAIDSLTQSALAPLISEVASQMDDPRPPSWITVYRWHRRYRTTRQARALIPRFDRRGRLGYRQFDRVLELFGQAVEEAYQASPAATMDSIHTRLVGKIRAENHNRLAEDQLRVPALRSSYRLFAKLEAYDQIRLKEGKAVADRRHRVARAAPQPEGILQRVEADHTPLDLFLIDERSGLLCGRPTLTVLIDAYSRFPIGYFLSFGSTSATAVMGALRHAILPKSPAVDAVPGLRIEHPWPCYGMIDQLVVDNGMEFHGTALEGVAMDLGMAIIFCPKRQPWNKGKIERFLQTFNFTLSHQLPGTSLARLADRGDYDPAKPAVLTMAEFKHVLEKWLLDIYAQTKHKGIKTTPWAKWHEGLARRTPELPSNVKDLQRRIGLVDERTLQRDGVTLKGIRYAGPELEPIMRAWGPGVKLRIVYDPEDLAAIQVWAPDQQEPINVLALDQSYAKGLTLVQHDLIRDQTREAGRAAENTDALLRAKYELAVSVDQLMQSRKQRSRRHGAKIQGITSNRPDATFSPPAPQPPVTKRPQLSEVNDEAPPLLETFKFTIGGH